MTKRLTILCDLDGIVANLLGAWLPLANETYGTALEIAHIDKWEIHECTVIGHRIYDLLTPDLFGALAPIPGALDALERLHSAGNHIVVVTASAKHLGTAGAKLRWIRRHLPWLDRKDVLIGHRKHLVRGDVLIDDSPANILEYRAAWPDAAIVTIDYPYNRSREVGLATTFRAQSHRGFAAAWEEIEAFILRLEVKRHDSESPANHPEIPEGCPLCVKGCTGACES